jgi:branched-chain amino acid transport system permease protein
MPLAVVLAVGATVLVGLVLERVGIRPTRGGLASLTLVTLGASLAIRGAADVIWGKDALPVPPFSSGPGIQVGAAVLSAQSLWVFGSATLAMVALYVLFNRTLIGRALIACGLNRYGATVIGIDVGRMRLWSFGLSAALGALAGALIAPITLASPGLGLVGVKGFAAAALGGFGSAPGAVIGGLALGVVEALGGGLIASQFKEAFAAVVLLGVLLIRPGGATEAGASDAEHERPRGHATGSHARLVFGILAALACAVPLLGNAYLTNLGVMVGLFALVGLGLGLLGVSGQMSLGHAAFMGIGAYTSAILTAQYLWPSVLALLAGVVITTVIAAAIGQPLTRLNGHYLALGTLAIGSIASEIFKHWESVTHGVAGIRNVPRLSVAGFTVVDDTEHYLLIWILVLLTGIGLANLMRSRIGRAVHAVAASDTSAAAVGVHVRGLKVKVFVLSAVVASVAGSLYAHLIGFVDPAPFGFDTSLRLVVLTVVGGSMSIFGPVLGAALVVGLSQVLQHASDWSTLLNGLLLVAIVVRLPLGLSAAFARRRG